MAPAPGEGAGEGAGERAGRPARWRAAMPWAVGLVLAIVMLGPALAPGPLFTLDLVLPSDLPVPRGVWGLGPELPRRVPLWLPLAWLSPLIGGDTAGKALMVASIVVAYAGMHRFASRAMGARASELTAHGAALLYALSPFLLTRLGVGHLMVAVPMAVLPWVLPTLLEPGVDLRRTFLAAFALGFAGHFGGTLAVVVTVAGLLATRGERALKVLGAVLVAQLPWVVPGIIVWSEGASIVDATPFASYADGTEGLAQLLAGHGFWNPLYQVGQEGGWAVGAVGLALLGLAVVGTRDLPRPWRRPLVGLAAFGLLAAAASAAPRGEDLGPVARLQVHVADAYVWLTQNPVGSIVREGQRLLPLYLVWLAPAAALGARHLARALLRSGRTGWRAPVASMVQVLPIVLAVLLAAPGAWGIDPRLRPIDVPQDWADARALIADRPGTVLALPWHQYFNLEVDGIRRTLNPLPLYLGGDVLASSNPELAGQDRRERVDPREPAVDDLVDDLRAREPVAARLRRLGVRWVVLLHEVDWLSLSSLANDPGLDHVLDRPYLDVYEVRGWGGLVVDGDGQPVGSAEHVEPWLSVDPSGPATVQRPGAAGWLRGLDRAGVSEDGLLTLPAGSGPVWFWPSLLALGATVVTCLFAVLCVVSLARERRRQRRDLRLGNADTI